MHGTTVNGRSRRGRRTVLSGALAMALGAVGLLLAAPAAQAQAPAATPGLTFTGSSSVQPGNERLVARLQVESRLDCATMSTAARKYATDHKLCPTRTDQASPQATMNGICGSSWIDIFDDVRGDGQARVVWGANSFLGVIVYRELAVSWAITPSGNIGPFTGILPDVGFWFSSLYEGAATALVATPAGVAVNLSGTVTLVWGGTCYVLPPGPSDFKPVT